MDQYSNDVLKKVFADQLKDLNKSLQKTMEPLKIQMAETDRITRPALEKFNGILIASKTNMGEIDVISKRISTSLFELRETLQTLRELEVNIPDFTTIYNQNVVELTTDTEPIETVSENELTDVLDNLYVLSKKTDYTESEKEKIISTYQLFISSFDKPDDETTKFPDDSCITETKNDSFESIKNYFDQNIPSYKSMDFYYQAIVSTVIAWVLEFIRYSLTKEFDPLTMAIVISYLIRTFGKK